MKIYFNTYAAAFQCPGGGEIQLLKSKEALERRGHTVVLFNQWEHSLEDADVLHHFSVQGGSYNICSYANNNKIPLVVSPILWLGEQIDQYPMAEIDYTLSLANVICPNSFSEIERFMHFLRVPQQKYQVTHNGVDSTFFETVPPGIFLNHTNLDQPFILCVGNIESRKNQSILLEAGSRLGIHVVLIGNVRDVNYYNELNRRFHGSFSFLGYFKHDSEILRSAYSACNVFALPSMLETPGLAALEAAASGAPLVITQEGCTQEYFGSEALYANPKSSDDVAQKIDLAMKKDRNSKNLKEKVRQFSWDAVAEELEVAYVRALAI